MVTLIAEILLFVVSPTYARTACQEASRQERTRMTLARGRW